MRCNLVGTLHKPDKTETRVKKAFKNKQQVNLDTD